MKNETAIVTGGGGAIGAAIARRLADTGATVIVCGRTEEPLRQTVADITSTGGAADYVCADVTKIEDWERLVDETQRRTGAPPSILVNNAARFVWRSWRDWDPRAFRDVVDSNLMSVMYGCRAVVDGMHARGGGSIVNVSSIHGLVGDKNVAPHVATKFGVNGLTLALAHDLKEHRIRVNAVCPGAVEKDAKKAAATSREWPPSRVLMAEEVADVAVFLCSPAARAVTGALLPVYGKTMASVRPV
ncbi:MAG TPA: SDR family oxidoreductase [Planctomycetota bacterium]|nr:SDR family oxidoreductase [Planctomycetota bacterium]